MLVLNTSVTKLSHVDYAQYVTKNESIQWTKLLNLHYFALKFSSLLFPLWGWINDVLNFLQFCFTNGHLWGGYRCGVCQSAAYWNPGRGNLLAKASTSSLKTVILAWTSLLVATISRNSFKVGPQSGSISLVSLMPVFEETKSLLINNPM